MLSRYQKEFIFFKVIDSDIKRLVEEINQRIKKKERTFIITLNSLMFLKCFFSKKYREVIKNADIIIPDGYGIVWASKVLGNPIRHHTPGINLMEELLSLAHREKYSVFLLGSTPESVAKAHSRLQKWFENARFPGKYHGYFSEEENNKVIEGINKISPDILFVGMGSPKQELWIASNIERLKPVLIMGVGGAIDIFAGIKKRAPLKWREMHLEWLYRIFSKMKFHQLILILIYMIIIFIKSLQNRILKSRRKV